MDAKFEHLVSEAQFAVCVMGTPDCSEFALLDFGPIADDEIRRMIESGMSQFVGILAIVRGTPRCALNAPLPEPVYLALSQAFVKCIQQRFGAALEDHFARNADVEYLQALWALPDERRVN